MTFHLVFFERLATRSCVYPFDVISRTNTYAMVSEERYIPPRRAFERDFYRDWPYGLDWRIIMLPDVHHMELIFERHLENDGRQIF